MRRLLLLAAIVMLSACKKSTTTPSGAEVLHWDKSMATRASVPGAKELAARTSKDANVVIQPEMQGPATLKLHVETAPVEIVEGKAVRHTTPVDVRAVVASNEDWTVTGKCQDGPHYQFGPVNADGSMTSPEAMVLMCDIKMNYVSTTKDLSYVANITIHGDGSLKASMAAGKATIEQP